VATVSRPLVRALFRPQVQGLEHLPKSGGFVLSSNQLSNLDGFALAYPLYPRQLWWMAKAELFNRLLGRFLRALRLFPVRRGEGDAAAVQTAVALAREGYGVGIFPEGTRRSKGLRKKREARPHTGAARVALAAGVPLVPAAIIGTERLTALRRWHVAFGQPVSLADLENDGRPAAREGTRRLWESITSLEADLRSRTARRGRWLRPRLVPDIALSDLLFALAACLRPRRPGLDEKVLSVWAAGDGGLVCLSVRSGFDLLLEALALAPGDEVAVSAITHPDMVRILEAHGLRAVPVDVDPETLAPRQEALERAITPRTRMLVVAHLFGSRVALEPMAELARKHGLLLVEDCAQSFRGPHDGGSLLADVSLFSFGAIKTASALGGALVHVRSTKLLERMRSLHAGRPVQRRREYAARVLKFVGLVLVARPFPYWLLERSLRFVGRDLDSFVNGAVKGFPGPDLVPRLRKQPSAPLLALLERRLRRFDRARLERRGRLGEYVAANLPDAYFHLGRAALDRTHWVLPVVAPSPASLTASLRRAGFDAATRTSSLASVAPPADRPHLEPDTAARIMDGIVFLPVYPELDDLEVDRLLAAVSEADGRGI
jgi:perosamine synthetase